MATKQAGSEDFGYYDTISNLSALEASDKVSFPPEQLAVLVRNDEQVRKERDMIRTDEVEGTAGKKLEPVHGYLGKVNVNSGSTTGYELKHTLLGGHVPRQQLETLSSTDFAHFFYKVLQCEDALKVYAKYVNVNARSTLATTPPISATVQVQELPVRKRQSGSKDGVKKVILCKKCKARFSGPRKHTNMKSHMCMKG